MRVRLRYAKGGPGRFTSHRDFARALERALRRAEIPMAYSSGFNPHPPARDFGRCARVGGDGAAVGARVLGGKDDELTRLRQGPLVGGDIGDPLF